MAARGYGVRMAANGIFCLEGEWESDLRKRDSVLPVLELLERLGKIKFIYRDAATTEEVKGYLTKWGQSRYDEYPVLYLATHGDKGQLKWGARQWMSLDSLAESLPASARGCWIYLGSCLTLFEPKDVRRFVDQTGVEAVLGYRKSVDWIESAAFDVILLSAMANHAGRPETFFKHLVARHGELASLLKFVVGTKSAVLQAAKAPRR